MSLIQKQVAALLAVVALVISACGTWQNFPETSDWCYIFDFVQSDQGFGISRGNWQLGTGLIPNEDGELSISYDHGSTVETKGVRIVTQRWPGITGNVTFTANGIVFGSATADGQFNNVSRDPDEPLEWGWNSNGGPTLNLSINADQPFIIRSIEIRGNYNNPFPTNSCDPDATNTPTTNPVSPTPSPTMDIPTVTITSTNTPTATQTATVTPSWSPSPTPTQTYAWECVFDFRLDDYDFIPISESSPGGGTYGTWTTGVGWVHGDAAHPNFDNNSREVRISRSLPSYTSYQVVLEYSYSYGTFYNNVHPALTVNSTVHRTGSNASNLNGDNLEFVSSQTGSRNSVSVNMAADHGGSRVAALAGYVTIHEIRIRGNGANTLCDDDPTATPTATATPTSIPPTATQTHDPTLVTNTPSGGGGATATSGPVISTTPVVGDTEWECTFNFALGQQGWIANQSIETIYSSGAWRNARTPNSLTAIRFNLNQSIILTYLQVIGSSNKARGDAPARGFRAGTNPIVISLFGWDSEDNGAYDVSWSGHMGIHEPYLLVGAGSRGIAGTTNLTIGQIVMRAFAATRPANNCTTNSIGPMPTFDQTYFITATPMPGQTLLPLPTAFPTFALTPSGTGEPGGGGTIGDGEDTCNGDILCIISNLIGAFMSMIGDFFTTILNIASVFFDLIVMAFRSLFDFIGMILNLISVLFQIAWGLLQQLFHFLAEVWEIIKLIFSIIWKLLQLAAAWIGQLVSSLQSIFYAWYLAPAQAIPFLPQCSTNPMANDVCAVYYVLNHTFFSGSIGMLLIPMLMLLMNLAMIIYFARNVKTILSKVGSIFR